MITTSGAAPAADLRAAWACWAGAVTLLTISDGRDDVGVTVSAFCPVSLRPPLVSVSLMETSYAAEVLGRAEAPPFAVTVLAAGQRVLAGRFAAEGRPGARHMLEDVPARRGAASDALIPAGGLAAVECAVERAIPAGDHLLVLARVLAVPYATEDGAGGTPLIRFRHRYLP